MTEFRPLFSGFAPSVEMAAHAQQHQEDPSMSNAARTAELILDALTAHGGSISGAQLRAELEGVDPVDRRNAINKLRAEGHLTSTGATTTIRYHSTPAGKASAETKASTATGQLAADVTHVSNSPVRDQFDVAEKLAQKAIASRSESTPDDALQVFINLPTVGSDEVCLMAGLEQLTEQLSNSRGMDTLSLARATAWLASKHQVSPT
ncbi:hypothetical protein U4I65_08475 [Stenotrophomonas maltophilia]|uniref:hypothetical protein n=1 Tax=Stenotrophomonas maltophilia TaxID=40324 RepID=UPI002ACD0E64|nr:hypothetical protein [Stenotrophomonas maltophilia]MDZ5815066.1 hypothetical protein [Stenotrophomonas maltophilia]